MKKSRLWTFVLCALLTAGSTEIGSTFETRSPSDIAAEDFTGAGIWSALGCAACAVGAAAVVWGGWGAILVASARPGSTMVAAGCIAACVDAFS